MKRRRHRERGSALAETAVIMTVLLMLMFGIIDFGRALYTYSFVAQLAREGARWAIVRGGDCTVIDNCPATSTNLLTYVKSLNEGATNASSITANLSFQAPPSGIGCSTSGNNAPGCVAKVTVTYPFTFMLPFLPKAGITMTGTSEMVISN
jgi:Flp pilus assembly protein TadG